MENKAIAVDSSPSFSARVLLLKSLQLRLDNPENLYRSPQLQTGDAGVEEKSVGGLFDVFPELADLSFRLDS